MRQSGEEPRTARRHALAYAELAERYLPTLAGDRTWFDDEHGNWSAALHWTLALHNNVVVGQRLVVATPNQLYSTVESLDWIGLALRAIDATTPRALVARLVLKDGKLRLVRGAFHEALTRLHEALALTRR